MGISPMAFLNLIGIIGGACITVWMQMEMVSQSILKPACIFTNFVMLVLVFTALRNLQIDYRKGMIASISMSLFPLAFNIYVLEALDGAPLLTSVYVSLVGCIFLLIVNFLIMVSGKGAMVDDGRFVDEKRFEDRKQKWRPPKKEEPIF